MVEISKPMFDASCRDIDCYLLLHYYNPSCWKSIPATLKRGTIGSMKFYSIVYLAQIAMRGKKMTKKEEWIKMGEYYIRSTLLGAGVSTTTAVFGCIFRWLMGNRFNYYTYLWIPNMINGLFIYLEPPSRRGLVINLFCNLVIEYWLRTLERDGMISILKSRSKQTFMFMIGSSLLFYLMRLEGERKYRTPLFWLYTPEKVRRKSDGSTNVCPHEGSCKAYIAKGYTTYFSVGLALTLARQLLPKLGNPLKAVTSLRGKHLKMALFFGSYISIYRIPVAPLFPVIVVIVAGIGWMRRVTGGLGMVAQCGKGLCPAVDGYGLTMIMMMKLLQAVVCYLCRRRGFDSALYALPAGYLAGLSFLFSPSLAIAIASLTAAFKLYSTILYEKKLLPSNMPLPELLYCFCQGTLFHARYMHPDVCPNYVFNLMKSVSNGVSEVLFKNLLDGLKMVP